MRPRFHGQQGSSRGVTMNGRITLRTTIGLLLFLVTASARAADEDRGLRVSWKDNILTIAGPDLPGREMKVLYIEAYCRPGSTQRKWEQTTIGHKTRLVSAAADGRSLVLECTLRDGVVV